MPLSTKAVHILPEFFHSVSFVASIEDEIKTPMSASVADSKSTIGWCRKVAGYMDDIFRAGANNADDLARIGLTSDNELAKMGINSADELGKLENITFGY